MTQSRSMPSAVLLALAIMMGTQALAQDGRGDIAAGRRLAQQWCSSCHQIAPFGVGGLAPTFPQVAMLPSTTALSLKVFLQTSHVNMPNIVLTRSEINDLVAYILSLKRR